MKTKVKSKQQNINIEIDIENSIFSKNKMRTVGTNDKTQLRDPPQQVIQQLPQPMYNSRLPDEFNLYNAIMASRNLYGLQVNAQPNLLPPTTMQSAQTPAPVMQSIQGAPMLSTPVQQPGSQSMQNLSLNGNLYSLPRPLSPPRNTPLTVQGSAQQPVFLPVQSNLSPPRAASMSNTGYAQSPSPSITSSMLHPLNQPQSLPQPVFQPMQNIHTILPIVDLQLHDDRMVGEFRRPLTDEEELKFINNMTAHDKGERERHIEGLATGAKTAYAPTIKKYRLEKYFPSIRDKFN